MGVNVYYRSNLTPDPESVGIDNIDGAELVKQINKLIELLVADNKRDDSPFEKESFVIAIEGGWGTGKTTASHAFINMLRTQDGFNEQDKFHVFNFELLPFSSINDSIGNILGSVASVLWARGVVDIRSEFKQMVLDALPSTEINAGVSLMGVALSRKLQVNNAYKENKKILRSRFEKLVRNGHRFLVMLDDLDRMKPDEVIVVTRMVENFKDIPGFIFVLPFYRGAVANAIHEELKLDEASSHVFLRKFIKASISIELDTNNLGASFEKETDYGRSGQNNMAVHSHFGMNTSRLIWFLLMHIITTTEAIAFMGNAGDANSYSSVFNLERSNYLWKLGEILQISRDPQTHKEGDSLPYVTDGTWKRMGDVFYSISRNANKDSTVSQLRSLLNGDTLSNYVYTSPEIVEEVRNSGNVNFDDQRAGKLEKETVFKHVLLPALESSESEPSLTSNYSRRDMQQIAKAIYNDPDFDISTDPQRLIRDLFSITYRRFNEFR